jgi:hypothetical protein
MKSLSPVVVPEGLCVEVLENNVEKNSSCLYVNDVSSPVKKSLYFSGASGFSYACSAGLFEGRGGSVYICPNSGMDNLLEREVSRFSAFLTSFQSDLSSEFSLEGSGFRVSFSKDGSFQHGVYLNLFLGSKKACVRVPFYMVSLSVDSGRHITLKTQGFPGFKN